MDGDRDFDEDDCWYLHTQKVNKTYSSRCSESSDSEEEEQDFQNAQRKKVPPTRKNLGQ